jgi:putative transposase
MRPFNRPCGTYAIRNFPGVQTPGYDQESLRDSFARVCFYILANPVRAGLSRETDIWPFEGAVIPGYPTLDPLQEDFWPRFWKLCGATLAPDAGNLKRP